MVKKTTNSILQRGFNELSSLAPKILTISSLIALFWYFLAPRVVDSIRSSITDGLTRQVDTNTQSIASVESWRYVIEAEVGQERKDLDGFKKDFDSWRRQDLEYKLKLAEDIGTIKQALKVQK